MSLRKQIKLLTVLFVVLLLGFAAASVALFRQNSERFDSFIHDKSREHIAILKVLSRMETGLYAYHHSFLCVIQKGDEDCVLNMKEAKAGIIDQIAKAESFNKARFPDWIKVEGAIAQNSEKEMRDMLSVENPSASGVTEEDRLQRMFYLLRDSVNLYFGFIEGEVKKSISASIDQKQEIDAGVLQQKLELLYLGVKGLKDSYNNVFWMHSRAEYDLFSKNSRLYYVALIVSCGILILLAVLIMILINRQSRIQQQRDETLILLGTRDMATGLFNRQSMEVLLTQEIHRAKRRNYPLNILMLRVEPFDEIRGNLGNVALDRLFFQISEILKSACRAYDSVFKYDRNTFVMVFPESSPKILNGLIDRFRKNLHKKRFLVKSDQTKVTPTLMMGASGFPLHGQNSAELLQHAEMTLSENFDAVIIHKQTPLAAKRESEKASVIEADHARPKIQESPAEPSEPESALETDAAAAVKTPPVMVNKPDLPVEKIADESIHNAVVETEKSDNIDGDPDAEENEQVDEDPSEDVTEIQAKADTDQDDVVSEDDVPDVVNALELTENSSEGPKTPATIKPAPDVAEDAQPTPPQSQQAVTNIKGAVQDGDDVILVDFDREKRDLAEKFRRKKTGNEA